MAAIPPLAMSTTKDDLMKQLTMAPETYTMMTKEADHVYTWLTSDQRHLKKNCKRKPPYDWSDIVEKSKDEAMVRIAHSSDPHTAYYWNLATPSEDCPNWIARWFLYHKFRYRDGRNRNPVKAEGRKHTYNSSNYSQAHHQYGDGGQGTNGYYVPRGSYYSLYSTDSKTSVQGYQEYGYSEKVSSTAAEAYASNGYAPYDPNQTYQYNTSTGYQVDGQEGSKPYWDPVRESVKDD